MGRFINGVHVSWATNLAPNERLGEGDDMEFNRLATQLEEENKTFKEDLENLATILESYDEARNIVIDTIHTIVRKYPNKQIISSRINELSQNSEAIPKILEYYIKKFS